METIINQDPIFEEAHQKYKQFTANDELMELYEARMKWQSQYKTDILDAREKGIQEGIKQGMQQIALKMLIKNQPIEMISDFTGLSREDIFKLQKEMEQ